MPQIAPMQGAGPWLDCEILQSRQRRQRHLPRGCSSGKWESWLRRLHFGKEPIQNPYRQSFHRKNQWTQRFKVDSGKSEENRKFPNEETGTGLAPQGASAGVPGPAKANSSSRLVSETENRSFDLLTNQHWNGKRNLQCRRPLPWNSRDTLYTKI